MPRKIPQRGNHRSRWTLNELRWVNMHYRKKTTREIAENCDATRLQSDWLLSR